MLRLLPLFEVLHQCILGFFGEVSLQKSLEYIVFCPSAGMHQIFFKVSPIVEFFPLDFIRREIVYIGEWVFVEEFLDAAY